MTNISLPFSAVEASPEAPSLLSFRPKDPISAFTHLLGAVAAVMATPVLLIRSALSGAGLSALISLSIFMLSMILLYSASASYHSFRLSKRGDLILKKMDHLSIFLLIAGSYTPVCVIVLPPETGRWLLALVWGFALCGMIFKFFWVTCPKWVSSVLYIAMGWLCVFALPQIWTFLPSPCFFWLLAGGLFYTVGGVIYSMKLPSLSARHPGFGSHELFHLFVLAGSFCHFMAMMGLRF